MPMLASRGCPYQCTFCSSPKMWGTTWVARDPHDVIREIKWYVHHFRIEHIEFHDLTTIINRRWILEFANALHEANLGITWTMPSGTRSEAIDAEVVDALLRSGCRGITYAPESGSLATLARIKKKVCPESMLESIRTAVASGLYVKTHLILGLPEQSWDEVWESFAFAIRLIRAGVDDLLVYPFNAYPGSEIYQELTAAGRIPMRGPALDRFLLDADYGDVRGVKSWSDHLTAAATRRLAAAFMLIFYTAQFILHPFRLTRSLRRLVTGRPRTWFERAISARARLLVRGSFVPPAAPNPRNAL
jgi:histone acetyltransferase (RNA polymerase elongator complex component)